MRWPTFRRVELEAKSTDSTDTGTLSDTNDWLLALFGAVQAASGVTVSGWTALQVPAVASAVRLISEAAASLEVKVVRIDGEEETEIPDHPAALLLRGDVNEWMSGFELIRDLIAHALLFDHGGVAYVNWVNGQPAEVIKYRQGIIMVDLTQPTGEPFFRVNGTVTPAQNIVHFRNVLDRCPVSMARDAIGIAMILERHVSKFFANGARPSGVLESPKAVGDKGILKMLAGWRAAQQGADNAGKTPLLWDGTTYKTIAFNSVDSQLLELRKHQVNEIARAFRVPPSMLFELDRATWSNSEQMGREFLVYSLEPWLKVAEAGLRRGLLTPEERKNHRIVFDRDDLTRANLGERATAYASLIASRIYSPNEIRNWDGAKPYPGGDEYANPNTGSNQPGAAAPQPAKVAANAA